MRKIIFNNDNNNYLELVKFTPKKLYFSRLDRASSFDKLLVSVGDEVKAGDKLALDIENNKHLVSSAGGKIVDISSQEIVVEVDISDLAKLPQTTTIEELLSRIREIGLVGMGGGGFPTHQKVSFGCSQLIINACECEPGITSDSALVRAYPEEIKKAIFFVESFFSAVSIAVKRHSSMTSILDSCSSQKTKILKLDEEYPIGSDRLLARKILKHTDYSKHIVEYDIISLNIATIFSIYQASNGILPLQRVVSVGRIGKSKNLEVPYGARVRDIFDFLGIKPDIDEIIISGGAMMGKEIDEDYIISAKDIAILIVKYKDEPEINCINCSKCVDNCPTGLYPQILLQEGKFAGDKEHSLRVNNLDSCIECAMCSYVCPSNIDLAKYFRKFKSDIRSAQMRINQEKHHEARRLARKERMKSLGRI